MSREAVVIYVTIMQQGHSAGQRLDVSDSVLSLKYDDVEKAASKLTLTVNNYDLSNFDNPIWRKGTMLEVSWGYAGNTTPTYSVIIQEVKGFQTLTVVALSKSILMHKVARVRKWSSVKRSDVVRQIAAENGYEPDHQHVDDTAATLPVVHQVRQTDAAFLQQLAAREGFHFHVDFDGLHWHERKLGQPPVREYTWFNDGTSGDILSSPTIKNDVTAKPASITHHGRDPIAKKDFAVTAGDADTARSGLAPVLEVVDPRTGATSLQAGTGQSTIGASPELTEASAKRHVDGLYKVAQMTTVLLTLPVIGDPRVRAKSVVQVNGIRSLSGRYYVAEAHDDVSQAGYKQTLDLRRDGKSEILPKAAASSAKQNTFRVVADSDTLAPIERVDPRTGVTSVAYVDARGRSQGEAGK